MLGYIISDKNEIIVKNYEIQSFDILHKTNLNIFVVKNNKVLYMNDIINNACVYGHIQVLEWFKKSDYEFKYNEHNNILKFYSSHINIKKLIKWSERIIFIKTFKFKTNNKYLKGYQKN